VRDALLVMEVAEMSLASDQQVKLPGYRPPPSRTW
jgi:hypothetical protein